MSWSGERETRSGGLAPASHSAGPGPLESRFDRRDFLRVATAITLPSIFRGDPYAPIPRVPRPRALAPIRIRGRVHGAGKGLAGVSVSDGLQVVATDRDGRFELVADTGRRFVTISVPSGYALPTHSTGTARCFQRITSGPTGEMRTEFPLTVLPEGDHRHAFLLLADIQTQNVAHMARFRQETVPDLRKTLSRLGAMSVFGVGDGDIMWDELTLYDDYETLVNQVGIPFVQVVGNHDLDLRESTDEGSTTTFERRFGPRYYSFDRGEIHYVVLDDAFYYGGAYLGYVPADQLSWLANDLARVERGRTVVVFAHIPLYTDIFARRGEAAPGIAQVVTNREAVYRLLQPYRTTVLSGHLHESTFSTEGGVWERNHGAACGAWWTGEIGYDGTPNGYGIFEASGSELRWTYQSTGKDAGHQLRTYAWGADPRAPEEILANVWSWEPGWTVAWYEDGERRGSMARRTGLDPLASQLFSGPKLPATREWIEPVPTSHLFYAPASRQAREIRVEATDRSGRTFSEVLRR